MDARNAGSGRVAGTRAYLRANRHWILFGIVGWTVLSIISIVDIGFQQVLQNRPFAETWQHVVSRVGSILPGALLTPLVFVAFRRYIRPQNGFQANLPGYLSIGVAYWLTWAAAQAGIARLGFVPGVPAGTSYAEILLRSIAGLSFNSLVVYAVMPLLFQATQYMREVRRQEMRTAHLAAALSRAHTAALGAQLNPHFLFNTLHVVSGLMVRDVRLAQSVLNDLGELLRRSLDNDGHQLVPLADEVDLAERYAAIQKARFGDRMEIVFDVDAAALAAPVPRLLLQPLVENAVQHGIARSAEGGWIRIEARRRAGWLVVTVVNSGPAADPAAPLRERVGIGGVRARLELIFGARATLAFGHLAAGGFRVEVELPELAAQPAQWAAERSGDAAAATIAAAGGEPSPGVGHGGREAGSSA
jgi:two-component system, LytTR family, sensor kinase